MAKSHIQLARADLPTLQEPEEGHIIIIIKTNNLTIKPKLIWLQVWLVAPLAATNILNKKMDRQMIIITDKALLDILLISSNNSLRITMVLVIETILVFLMDQQVSLH